MMKPHFKDGFLFLKELFAAEIPKTEIKMKNPLYPGEAILGLSKIFTCQFHYEHMQPKYETQILKSVLWWRH